MKIFIDRQRCRGNGECIKVCPYGALRLESGKAVIDRERCRGEGLCIPVCPRDAITPVEDA